MKLIEGKNARWCLKCDTLKHFDNFRKKKNGKYGLHSWCGNCERLNSKKYVENNPDKIKDNNRKFKKNNPDYFKNWRNKKKLSKKKINNSIERNFEAFRDKLNQSKFCTKCNEYKSFNNFNKQDAGLYGYSSWCNKCLSKNASKWYGNNKEKVLKQQKEYYEENKERIKEYSKYWRESNKEEIRKRNQIYYQNNKDRILKRNREYRRKKYQNDINFKIRIKLSSRITDAVKNNTKSKSTKELLGISIEQLKNYLETQFEEGMNWNNYSKKGWHIDHIIPCASYDLSKPHHQEECFFYTNLQPLWAEENHRKSDKLT